MTLQKLVTPEAVKHINDSFISLRNKLAKIALQDHDSIQFAHTLTFATDEWLLDLWEEAIDPHLFESCTLFALGGYGRRELCFYSDLDLVIEVPDDSIINDPALSLAVERFMAWTRDARVKLSHAVRTTQQALQAFEEDPRTAISLIDARPLDTERTCGWQCVDAQMALNFLRGNDHGETFLNELTAAHHERRKRHGQTVYLLEPDLKNGDGGLRDLNNIHWAARVRHQFDVLTELRPELDWNEEHQAIYIRGLRWLLGLRTLLHITHNRKHDRLNFADQEALAKHLSQLYPDNYPPGPIAATETLMRNHYRYARAVSRTSQQFLRHWNIPDNTTSQLLGSCFESVNQQLALQPRFTDQHSQDHITLEDSQILEALAVASREDIPLDPALELYIDSHVQNWSESQRENPALNTQFLELLTDPKVTEKTSQYLLELGILTKLVPEFEPIVCHVQHDIYHVYTTDVHSLKCLEMARSLIKHAQSSPTNTSKNTPPPHKWPAFEEIAAQIQDVPVFLLAALFHDIGKNRGGRHSQKGAALVIPIAQRLGLQRRRADQLAFLVREHLTLSLTARRRDISDRRVIRDLAQRLRTVETLNLLTALTLCDVSTVGPDLMSDWNASLLIDLYRRLKDALEHGVESMWIDQLDQVDDLRDDLLNAWQNALANDELPPEQQDDAKIAARIDEFIRDAPGDHLLASSPDALLRQFIAYDHGVHLQGTAVLTTPLPEDGVTEIILSTQDVPGTLAKIAGTISSAGLNIVTANIVTTSSGRTLDIFLVHLAHSIAGPHRSEPTALTKPDRIQKLEENLRLVLDGKLDVEQLLERKIRENRLPPRPTPSVDTSVTIHQNLSDAFTVLEVMAPDQIGLLYTITHTLWQNGINTHVSKIDSVGNQVVDTFYIEDIKGGKISPEKAATIITALHQILQT